MQWAFILYFSATRNCWFSRNIPWKIKESSRSRKFSTKPEVCHAFQATDELTNFFFDVATSIFQLSDWDKRVSYILKFSLLQMNISFIDKVRLRIEFQNNFLDDWIGTVKLKEKVITFKVIERSKQHQLRLQALYLPALMFNW